jgi:hypothetical protein
LAVISFFALELSPFAWLGLLFFADGEFGFLGFKALSLSSILAS